MESESCFIGVDVSKASLDVATYPSNETWQVPNDVRGVDKLVSQLSDRAVQLIVLEATGGLETPLAGALANCQWRLKIAHFVMPNSTEKRFVDFKHRRHHAHFGARARDLR